MMRAKVCEVTRLREPIIEASLQLIKRSSADARDCACWRPVVPRASAIGAGITAAVNTMVPQLPDPVDA